MTTCFLAPDPIQSTFLIPGGNTVGNGVQIFCYTAGSTTKSTVYKDNAAAASWTNPIVLDSGGNLPSGGSVWIPTGVTMKFVYAPSNDTDPPASPYRTLDNISGVNDVGGAAAQSQWVAGPTPTFVSGTSFTLVGDQTATFHAGRRLQSTNTAGTIYSTILTSVFTSLTTVTVANDSGALDSGLSAVNYGLISAVNTSDPNIFGKSLPALGYNIRAFATTSAVTVTADYIQCNDPNGYTVVVSSFSRSPDITTTGINGLDTGAESSNTWYYIYAVANAQASSGAILSVQSSAPTMPSGYTYKALISAVRNDAASSYVAYHQTGRRIFFDFFIPVLQTGSASTRTFVSTNTYVPPIAESISCQSDSAIQATSSGVINANLYFGITNNANEGIVLHSFIVQGLAANTLYQQSMCFDMPNISSNGFYYNWGITSGSAQAAELDILSFTLPGGGQ